MDGNLAMHQEDFESYAQYEKQNNMLKANELRIGNTVLINGLRTEVSLLVLKHLIEENIQLTIEGLEISEEILLKCGFVENGDTSQFHLGDQICSFNKLDGVHFWIMDTDKCIRCKFFSSTTERMVYT